MADNQTEGKEEKAKTPAPSRTGLPELLAKHGHVVGYRLAYTRIKNGWDPDKAASTPSGGQAGGGRGRTARTFDFEGEQLGLTEIAEKTGISRATLVGRLNNGWEPEKAFTTPVGVRAPGDAQEPDEDEVDEWDEDEDEDEEEDFDEDWDESE